MDIVHAATLLLHADVVERGKPGQRAVELRHGNAQHMHRGTVAVGNDIPAIQFNVLPEINSLSALSLSSSGL